MGWRRILTGKDEQDGSTLRTLVTQLTDPASVVHSERVMIGQASAETFAVISCYEQDLGSGQQVSTYIFGTEQEAIKGCCLSVMPTVELTLVVLTRVHYYFTVD